MSEARVRARQVWRVWFPFAEDSTEGEYRPVVIREIADDGYVVIYITSQVKDRRDYVILDDWHDAGLRKRSAVVVTRMLRIPVDSLGDYVGDLTPDDRLAVQTRMIFGR